ncbi:MAG: tRNA glutamyl-Q(34) synthetase GluQRS [Proteobacteria bacterium]|nr:tRNA glutamyl-Q(34) synthetase GluQRS [Pseudomonadota bacterium]
MRDRQRSSYRGRFAPSPTGDLHFGSLLAALGSWLCARRANGAWLVRIDDIDPPREVPGSAGSILRTLRVCGLEPDEPPWHQGTRAPAYEDALQRLRADGYAFPCRCSRSDLAANGGAHRGACVVPHDSGTAFARDPAWRVRVDDAVIVFEDGLQGLQRWPLAADGDFVVKRADGPFAYQLACAVDDAAQGITEVVRGADLLDSTPRQIFLMRLLGLREPAYLHLPVAVTAAGEKLSKSSGARAIDAHGPAPALRAALALLGIPAAALRQPSPRTLLRDALAAFEPAALPHARILAAPGFS